MRPSLKALILLLLVVAPAVALGARMRLFEVRTVNNLLFDVMIESSMGMSNGLRDAYDGCYMLRVDGSEVRVPSATIIYAGRGVQSPRANVNDLTVSRKVYMPSDGDWARYYDLIINSSRRRRTVEVEIYGNLGSDSATKITGTSDGDMQIEVSDTWFATDDFADGDGDPSLAHVFRRTKGRSRPDSVRLERDNISVSYQVKLAPRARAAFLFFAVQTKNSAEATKVARRVAGFGKKAREHLSAAEIRAIRN